MNPRHTVSLSRRLASLALFGALTSCGSPGSGLFEASRVDRQHEAGSVHVAVLSVASWEEYVVALQPNFDLTEAQALEMVVPSTRTLESSLIDAVRASGSLVKTKPTVRETLTESTGTSTSDDSTTGEETVDDQGNVQSTQDTTGVVKQDSVTRERTTPDPYSPQVQPGDGVPVTQVVRQVPQRQVEPTADIDPFMRYSAATALFQEVQLLNRYVKDAAIRQGFTPYAVRMQVALMPRMRNEPYDAYCTMSFFSDIPLTSETELAERSGTGMQTMLRGGAADRFTPQVIPLLVTDNLEATLASRTAETIRQLAGSLYIMSGQVGGSVGMESFQSEFESVFGKDLNSLLTVGRVSDNTIRVRLGAMQQASSNFSMVPRTHTISVLLMVPSQLIGTPLQIVTRTTMVDVDTGEALPDRTALEIAEDVRSVIEKYSLTRLSDNALWELIGHVQSNDQRRFFASLQKAVGANDGAVAYGKSLWVDLALLTVGSQYAATEIDLPPMSGSLPLIEPPLFPLQTVFLVEENESSVAVVRGTGLLDAIELQAILYVVHEGKSLPLRAEQLEVDPDTGDLRIVFPSLVAWSLAESARVTGNLSIYLASLDQEFELATLYRAETP